MPYDDDLPLHDPSPPLPHEPRRRPTGPSRWVILAAVIVTVGSLLALWWLSRARPVPTPPTFTNATGVPVASPRPKSQPMQLPSLDASDELLRQIVSTLSQNPMLARLVTPPSIVRSAAQAVEQIGNGKTPSVNLKPLRPPTRVTIVGTGSGPIDPRSYHRWDSATATLVSLPPDQVAQAYVNVKPLFDQAYQELGHLNGDFDRAIVKAIDTLNDTPVQTGEPVLLVKPGYLEHEDPALKALLPVQRQFILLGPENQKQVLAWLKGLASSLDLKGR
jgi:hypothetical protein